MNDIKHKTDFFMKKKMDKNIKFNNLKEVIQ